jgi:hypothetical protein
VFERTINGVGISNLIYLTLLQFYNLKASFAIKLVSTETSLLLLLGSDFQASGGGHFPSSRFQNPLRDPPQQLKQSRCFTQFTARPTIAPNSKRSNPTNPQTLFINFRLLGWRPSRTNLLPFSTERSPELCTYCSRDWLCTDIFSQLLYDCKFSAK